MNREVTWENCVDLCRCSNNIVVSGCQRSGTTYAARALAKDLNYKHYDEHDFGVTDFSEFLRILRQPEPKVIQAPAILHELKSVEMTSIIVIMKRDEKDVAASMLKHNWFKNNGQEEYAKYTIGQADSPEQIYRTKIQFSKGLKCVELPYKELEKTEGFEPNRVNWHIKQTKN